MPHRSQQLTHYITVLDSVCGLSLTVQLTHYITVLDSVCGLSLTVQSQTEMHPPQKCIWSHCDLELWSMTLKSFQQCPLTCFVEISPQSTEISCHAK